MRERQSKLGCPGSRELELYCLGELAAVTTTEFISTHLHLCPRCRRRLRNMESFYTILARELERPVEPRLLDFCKQRAPKPVKYGLLVCTPLPEKDRGSSKAYLASLAFAANGDGSKTMLADFTLASNQIGIMLYSNPVQNELLLFLWSPEAQSGRIGYMHAPGLFTRVEFSGSGGAKIPLLNFDYLHNRLLYVASAPAPRRPKRLLTQVRETLV